MTTTTSSLSSVPDALTFLVWMITRGPSAEEPVTETQAPSSIAQLVFFNTTTEATNVNRTEKPLSVYIGRSFKFQGWRNGEWDSQTWVVCELSPCHVPGEEDGVFRDTTFTNEGVVSPPGLRRELFDVGYTDNKDHIPSSTTSAESFPWQTRSNSSSISRGNWHSGSTREETRYLHHYEQRNDCWSCLSWRGYDNSVQTGGSRQTDHPSHHPCSELRILQHSDQDFL